MEFLSTNTKDFNLEKYLSTNEDINMLVCCNYDTGTHFGVYRIVLEHKGRSLYIEGHVENSISPNHTCVIGMGEAVKRVTKSGVNTCIITGISFSIDRAGKCKGKYAKELQDIIKYAEEQGNTISSILIKDGMEAIKSHIYSRIPQKPAPKQETNKPSSLAELQGMDKKFIMVTGISGCGKTTLSRILSEKLKGIVYSVDEYKEDVYEETGFLDIFERKVLNSLAKDIFKRDVMVAMRNNAGTVIVEYPFNSDWREFFVKETSRYGYKFIAVNCISRDFDDIWAGRLKRDLDPEKRPRCLIAGTYVKGELFQQDEKLEEGHRREQLACYQDGTYTSIVGDYNYTDAEMRKILEGENTNGICN